VDVDIHQRRIKRDPQHGHWIASPRQGVGIGCANGGQDLLVLHRAAIDESILRQRVGLVPGRQPDVTGKAHLFARCIQCNRIGGKLIAQHLGNARESVIARRRKVQCRAVRTRKRKAHGGEGDGDAPDSLGNRCGFRAIGF